MKEELIKKIKAEIQKTGFPLELRVAKILENNNYYVQHSAYYVDEDENKSREIDIKAVMHRRIDDKQSPTGMMIVRNCLVVECKKSDNKPWVFLSSDKGKYDVNYDEIYIWQRKAKKVFSFSVIDDLEEIHPFNKYTKISRSYFEAFKNNEANEMIFKAITGVSKAANYFTQIESEHDINIAIPMIVFDGQIFEGVLNSDGDIDVQEVDSVLMTFNYKTTKTNANYVIPVMKENIFEQFIIDIIPTLEVLINDIKWWRQLIKEENESNHKDDNNIS